MQVMWNSPVPEWAGPANKGVSVFSASGAQAAEAEEGEGAGGGDRPLEYVTTEKDVSGCILGTHFAVEGEKVMWPLGCRFNS